MDELDYLAVIYYNKDNRKDNSILNRLEEIGKYLKQVLKAIDPSQPKTTLSKKHLCTGQLYI